MGLLAQRTIAYLTMLTENEVQYIDKSIHKGSTNIRMCRTYLGTFRDPSRCQKELKTDFDIVVGPTKCIYHSAAQVTTSFRLHWNGTSCTMFPTMSEIALTTTTKVTSM